VTRPWEDFGTREIPEWERLITEQMAERMTPLPRDHKPITWADIQGVMEKLGDTPSPRSLHCGAAVWELLRGLAAGGPAPEGLAGALGGAPLYGIPVHVDPDMAPGRWEFREGDRVVGSGDVAPHPGALWLGDGHWIAFDDLTETYPGSGIYE
jgi:hypothetical protein